ncbi:uncharacterized protein EAF02_001491 [Botrytis sinoallii]|uniref:uncharacterized protein n=1 Tax=Botrytis sinoallii TaxID=1463999 RepID=UPI00190241F4|nr:uncharacterized protein EAF02_001491 [Botrytis sinoallii]KAF7891166.1 hypothetical protein EAF02_001491 [Botrytis sinoallii]
MKTAAKVDLCSLLGSIGYLPSIYWALACAGTPEQDSLSYTFSRGKTIDVGQWAMGNGQWAMGNEQ